MVNIDLINVYGEAYEMKKANQPDEAIFAFLNSKGLSPEQIADLTTPSGQFDQERAIGTASELARPLVEKAHNKVQQEQVAQEMATINEIKSELSRKKNWAIFKIVGGVALIIIGLVIMSSGAETSGRRSPIGVVIAGGFVIFNGIQNIMAVDKGLSQLASYKPTGTQPTDLY